MPSPQEYHAQCSASEFDDSKSSNFEGLHQHHQKGSFVPFKEGGGGMSFRN